MSSKPVIDDQILEDCYLGDAELIAEVVQVFVEQADGQLAAVVDAARRRDADAISKTAHKLKGGLLTIGGAAAADLALQIEQMGRTQSLDGVQVLARSLSTEMDRLIEAFRARGLI
ncbi:MAG: Hpt domain-containing protein [Myxococcales bacterium]|nr:Hpt domain-containing protein [Myxococcales bacterium]